MTRNGETGYEFSLNSLRHRLHFRLFLLSFQEREKWQIGHRVLDMVWWQKEVFCTKQYFTQCFWTQKPPSLVAIWGITLYEKQEAMTAIYRMFEVGKSSRYLTSYGYFKKHFPHEYKRWLTRTSHLEDKNHARQLIEDDEAGREYAEYVKHNSKQEFRFLAKGQPLSMELAIVDEAVAITSFDPMFIVIIYSKALADSATILFDMAWEMGGRENSSNAFA